jgi:hypothetical protein
MKHAVPGLTLSPIDGVFKYQSYQNIECRKQLEPKMFQDCP